MLMRWQQNAWGNFKKRSTLYAIVLPVVIYISFLCVSASTVRERPTMDFHCTHSHINIIALDGQPFLHSLFFFSCDK